MLHREVVTFALTHRPESVTPHRSQTRRLKRVIFVIFSMLNADRKRTLAVRFSTAAFEMPQIFVARQVQWPAAGPPLTTPNLELSASENRARWLHPPPSARLDIRIFKLPPFASDNAARLAVLRPHGAEIPRVNSCHDLAMIRLSGRRTRLCSVTHPESRGPVAAFLPLSSCRKRHPMQRLWPCCDLCGLRTCVTMCVAVCRRTSPALHRHVCHARP